MKPTLCGHQKPVLTVSWSPDDSQILPCGQEEGIRRWDFSSEECCKGQRTFKISDMSITDDDKRIISIFRESAILLLDWERKFERLIEEVDMITSFSLSKDNKFLLVNLIIQENHLWSIEGDPTLLSKYKGHKTYPICNLLQVVVMAANESSRLRAFLDKENVPVGRLIVNQILHPSASDCKFCAVKRKELKPKKCRGGWNYNLTGGNTGIGGRLRGGRYRDGRQGLVAAGRERAIDGLGWSEGEVPCFSVLVPSRNFHSKADQETSRSSATKFQI
ncbi:hypothetical protein QUC31_006396 [Theobroma cacao]